MTRKLILLLTAVSLIAFTGCSDDKDDEGGVDIPGGGTIDGITILPKRIATISPEDDNVMKFTYDTQGRVTKMTGEGDITVIYADNKVTMTRTRDQGRDNETVTYTLANKRVVSFSGSRDVGSYEYDKDGYMTKSSEAEIGYEDQSWVCNYTWTDGLLTKIAENTEDKEDKGEIGIVTYGTQPNNLNLDLLPILEFDFLGNFATILGFGSKRCAKLPTKVSWDGGEYSESFTYETNKDGYITKITMIDDEKAGSTYTYTITYE